jgi:hypothetical protein
MLADSLPLPLPLPFMRSIPLCSAAGDFIRRISLEKVAELLALNSVVTLKNKRGAVSAAFLRQPDGGHPLRGSVAGTSEVRRSRGRVVGHKPLPDLPQTELLRLFYGPTLECITA